MSTPDFSRVRRSILRTLLSSEFLVLPRRTWLFMLVDVAAVVIGFRGVVSLYELFVGPLAASNYHITAVAFVAGVIFMVLNDLSGLYNFAALTEVSTQVRRSLSNWLLTWALMSIIAFSLKYGDDISRGLILTIVVFGVPALIINRFLIRLWLTLGASRAYLARVPVGLIEIGDSEAVLGPSRKRYRPVAWLSLNSQGDERATSDRFDDFLERARGAGARKIAVAVSANRLAELQALQVSLDRCGLEVILLTDRWLADVLNRPAMIAPSVTAFELGSPPLTLAQRTAKRFMDLVIASLALILLSPLLGAVAIAVKLDSPGPIIFRQRRRGFNGKDFYILKFRSMTVQEDGAVVQQAKQNDARITRVGRFIRATSLDELPQLVNILLGEMSAIGPRPHAIAHDDYYGSLIADYSMRRHMRPGLTGWAQVNGRRGETPTVESMEDRIRFDIWYVQNWSIWLDVWILIRTVFAIISNRNVY